MKSIEAKLEQRKIPTLDELREQALSVLSLFESDDNYIDEGGAAKVFRLPVGLCMKLIDNRDNKEKQGIYDLGNGAIVEHRLQMRVANVKYEGNTRVPKTFGVLNNIDRQHRSALIMEELNAVNLQKAINGKVAFPESFNLDDFFVDLEGFVDEMHTQAGIAHGDIYARNIMIDIETGSPRIIDFGRSVALGQDKEKNRELMNNDWRILEEIYATLSSLQE